MDAARTHTASDTSAAGLKVAVNISQQYLEHEQDERDRLIFRLLLMNKWFLIPASVSYEWLLSISPFRAEIYGFIPPTVIYIAASLTLIVALWITHHRIAEGNADRSYTTWANGLTIVSNVLDLVFVFFLILNPSGGNLIWSLFLFPLSLPLLAPRFKKFSSWIVDGVAGSVLFTAILGSLYSFEMFASPRSFVEGELLVCFGGLLFMWVSLRIVRAWIDGLNRYLRQFASILGLWTELLNRFPTEFFLTNEKGELLIASSNARALLPLPEIGESRWNEAAESVRNALLLRFHSEKPIDEPVTIPDDTLPVPVKIHPAFFGYGNQRFCIALIQEESSNIGESVGVLRSDRLAIAGQIAAGLAHEIGNPLGVIRACANYLRQKAKEDDPNVTEYELIETESQRCQNLIDRLLSLASPKRDTPGLHDLRDTLNHAISMVKYQATNHEIEVSLPQHEVLIYANEGQISAVFVNLLLNAIQSMESSPPGAKLRVHMKQRGEDAIVDITDEGCGISSEELEKIFDPFFTKKAAGTGLGLSIVHQIITALGGQIDVASRVGSGTTFTVRLPLFQQETLS